MRRNVSKLQRCSLGPEQILQKYNVYRWQGMFTKRIPVENTHTLNSNVHDNWKFHEVQYVRAYTCWHTKLCVSQQFLLTLRPNVTPKMSILQMFYLLLMEVWIHTASGQTAFSQLLIIGDECMITLKVLINMQFLK